MDCLGLEKWLRGKEQPLLLLQKTQGWYPASQDGSQPPINPDSGNLTLSSGLWGLLHSCTAHKFMQACTCTHKLINEQINKSLEDCFLLRCPLCVLHKKSIHKKFFKSSAVKWCPKNKWVPLFCNINRIMSYISLDPQKCQFLSSATFTFQHTSCIF